MPSCWILAIRSLSLPGAGEALTFLFHFDPSELSGKSVMSALGQALFSLSLGMGAMITYGSYLPKKEQLAPAGVAVAFFDTSIAMLAGLIIFPAIFSFGHNPQAGAGLVFQVLPSIFHSLPAGTFFAVAFYALLGIAALTSTISLLEVVVAYFVDEKKWKRERAVWTVVGVLARAGHPVRAVAGGQRRRFSKFIAGKGFLDIQNILWGNISLAVGAVLICLFVGWKWGTDSAEREIGRLPLADVWSVCVKFVCPIAIVAVLVYLLVTGDFL